MKANPDKFQALAVGERDRKPIFRIGEAQIECETTVKLLGIETDYGIFQNMMYKFQFYCTSEYNATSDWITIRICDGIFCDIPSETRRHE